jgi:multiple sugar transport system permease protein
MAMISADNRGLRLATRYAVLVLIAVIFLFPLVFMVMSSFKPTQQLLQDASDLRAFLPVGDISFDNYTAAFQRAPVATFVFNSVLVTGITVALSLLVCSAAAFAFVFVSWTGRDVLLTILLATLILPFETIAIPLLLMVAHLPWIGLSGLSWGWLNSYHVQIVPFIADGLTIFLFVQYFKDLPGELIEAARVEGASWFQVMYNQYLWPKMVTQEEGYRPVMVGLQYFFQLNVVWGEVMAYLSLITIPVLAFYLYLQKAFIASIASTGVKG